MVFEIFVWYIFLNLVLKFEAGFLPTFFSNLTIQITHGERMVSAITQ